jgi:hypothetical protein
MQLHNRLLKHVVIHFLRDAGLEFIDGVGRHLPMPRDLPVLVFLVVPAQPTVELIGETTDRPRQHVLGFGGVDAAGAEAADVPRRLDEQHVRTLACRGDGCGDSAGCGGVDDEIGGPGGYQVRASEGNRRDDDGDALLHDDA